MWHARGVASSGLRPDTGRVYGSRNDFGFGFVGPRGVCVTTLDLALVGNGSIGALVDAKGGVVWCCFPRFDGDPVFSSLLGGEPAGDQLGVFTIELEGTVKTEQRYLSDTPILVTRFYDRKGGGVEITDFCPRFEEGNELFAPKLLVRQVRPIGGRPSIRVHLAPAADYGCTERQHKSDPQRQKQQAAGHEFEPARRLPGIRRRVGRDCHRGTFTG